MDFSQRLGSVKPVRVDVDRERENREQALKVTSHKKKSIFWRTFFTGKKSY